MRAILFYLTTFGYIDGEFDDAEKQFVRDYVADLVRHRVEAGFPEADEAMKAEVTQKFTAHFHEVFEEIDRHVHDLFTESVADGEDPDAFVHAKLKQRCFEIFHGFDQENQNQLLDTVDKLIHADGQVHPAEIKFRTELSELLEADLEVELLGGGASKPVAIHERAPKAPNQEEHPFFDQFEHHYSRDPSNLEKQIQADCQLLEQARSHWEEQRAKGKGLLAGKSTVQDLLELPPFLDGFVYAHPAKPSQEYELLVLGDLHGCYSNLKAAILQANFFDRVAAYRNDPEGQPMPLLILLGDYIDRGRFSLNGVLRTVLQLFLTAPEHVYVLRGNHEYYIEYNGRVYGGVKPAEAINTLKPHVSEDVFRDYMRLFEAMPSTLLFGDMLFVHAGIPRDRLIKERFQDLSFLNDSDARFQMMWSDPSSADVIPSALQEQTARFPFGKLQAKAFLNRIGCHTLVRGHEKVVGGFMANYSDDDITICTLFSAGGMTNEDLPVDSSYRSVVPHALTIRYHEGKVTMEPWEIEYDRFNDPDRNAFFRAPPQIEHVAG